MFCSGEKLKVKPKNRNIKMCKDTLHHLVTKPHTFFSEILI